MPIPQKSNEIECSDHLQDVVEDLLTQMVELLVAHGVMSFEQSAVFIDGTKIEANANRYSFVWKTRVTKSQAKLGEKIAEELPVLLEKAEAGVVVPKNIKQPIQRKENPKTAMSRK